MLISLKPNEEDQSHTTLSHSILFSKGGFFLLLLWRLLNSANTSSLTLFGISTFFVHSSCLRSECFNPYRLFYFLHKCDVLMRWSETEMGHCFFFPTLLFLSEHSWCWCCCCCCCWFASSWAVCFLCMLLLRSSQLFLLSMLRKCFLNSIFN